MTTKKIGFVTDSTCDLPQDIIEQHGITVVPCFVNYRNSSYADDHKAMVRAQFYKDLPHFNPYPTTSAMSPGLAEEFITRAAQDADHLFIIAVASKLSGVYNALRLGASKLPADRVTLIDSESVTMGMGFQVLIGAEVAEATGDIAAVQEAITRVRKNQYVYAALETMEYLRRSGRVGWAAASLGTLLQIKPLIAVRDSEVFSISRVRTFARAMDELIRLVESQLPLDRLAVLYASETEAVEQLYARLESYVSTKIIVTSVTPTIGVHIGPSGLGVATLSSGWRI